MEKFLFLVLILAAILLFIFWLRQFIQFMERGDDTFTGRYDKLIWAAVFLLFGPLGAFIFIIAEMSHNMAEPIDVEMIKTAYEHPCLRCEKTIPANSTHCPSCGWSYKDEINK